MKFTIRPSCAAKRFEVYYWKKKEDDGTRGRQVKKWFEYLWQACGAHKTTFPPISPWMYIIGKEGHEIRKIPPSPSGSLKCIVFPYLKLIVIYKLFYDKIYKFN